MIYNLLVQAAQSLFSINIINNPFVITRGLVFYIRLKQDQLSIKYNIPYKKVKNNIKGLYE